MVTKEKLLEKLRILGYTYPDVQTIFKAKILPSEVVAIILDSLEDIYKQHLGSGDQLVRSLISAEEPFDPTELIRLYEKGNYNDSVKDGIGIVLSHAPTFPIDIWLKDQLENRPSGFHRISLIYGLEKKAGFTNVDDLMNFCQTLFDKYRYDALFGIFKRYARDVDVAFLQSKEQEINDPKGKKEIQKLIGLIEKRKKKYVFPIRDKK